MPAGPVRGRRVAFIVAVAFTGAAFALQAAYAFGLVHGSPVPALRGSPLPLLLIAAPAWALAARGVTPPARLYMIAQMVEINRRRAKANCQGVFNGNLVFEATVTGMSV